MHGLWLHGSSWEPWLELFREQGYAPVAPAWPGESDTVPETRMRANLLAGYGIDAVVDHYAKLIGELEAKPIVIGHSFGGLIAQRLLGQELAAAAVAIDPAPIKGVLYLPPSALRVAFVALRHPAKRKGVVVLTPKQFRYGFGNTLSERESRELYDRCSIPSPGRPLFEAAAANFSRRSPTKVDTANATRGPLLLVSALADHTVPAGDRQTDAQALRRLRRAHRAEGVPRPRPFAHDRQRLAGRRRDGARVAAGAAALSFGGGRPAHPPRSPRRPPR